MKEVPFVCDGKVAIICDGKVAGDHAERVIEAFYRAAKVGWIAGDGGHFLDGERLIERGARMRGLTDPRSRWPLQCSCGLNVTVRHERLVPVLDALADTGRQSLTLRALSSIVS